MEYDVELDSVIDRINKKRSKLVCIQLPDGLKPQAGMIKKEIEKRSKATVLIWTGSCFGACDIPAGLERLGVDLLVQFGHSEWK
jgi:diphthamide biosynthesis enzyme Dph1/Dph2-like protein